MELIDLDPVLMLLVLFILLLLAAWILARAIECAQDWAFDVEDSQLWR